MQINNSFFTKNRTKFISLMANNSIAVFGVESAPFKSSDSNYTYYFNRSLYYLTGITDNHTFLLIAKIDDVVTTKLFIAPIDLLKSRWYGKRLTKKEAYEISNIKDIDDSAIINPITRDFDVVSKVKEELFTQITTNKIKEVYLEMSPYNTGESLEKSIANQVIQYFPLTKVINSHEMLSELRKVKEKEEVEAIKKAIDITDLGIKNILNNLTAGIKEYQVAANFIYTLNYNNCQPAFPTIVGAGSNALCLHYETLQDTLQDSELVLLDLGASYLGYSADISRTFPINGKFSPRQKELYTAVLNCQKAGFEALKNKQISWVDVEKAVKVQAGKELFKLKLIKDETDDKSISKYYWHSVGHHLGLDTHDIASKAEKLQPGMVYTVEPGLYIPEWNMGIRIEDDVLITESGYINLSESIIKEIDEIENFMRKEEK